MDAQQNPLTDLFDEVAYLYDGSLEGLLSAVFEAYARKEHPSDVISSELVQPRLSQRIHHVATNDMFARRVQRGIVKRCGKRTFWQITKASTSSDPRVGYIIYRFIRYAIDEHADARRALSNRAHPPLADLLEAVLSVENECERMRQFARFEHLKGDDIQVWFANVNPKHAVIPLVLGHFVERFNVQPFIIFDETHNIAGVWDGAQQHLIQISAAELVSRLPHHSANEVAMQEAWRTFYRAVSIDARYNPELRRQFMPLRLWKNITEMQEDIAELKQIDPCA